MYTFSLISWFQRVA